MNHPRGRRWRLAGLALSLLMALVGCSSGPQPAASPTPEPVTARALAALVEAHFGAGMSAYAGGDAEAVVLYGAEPWAPTRDVRLTYDRNGPWWASDDDTCRDAGTGTPPVQCMARDGVRMGWQPELDAVWVASPRANGVVTAALGNVRLPTDPRRGELPEEVSTLIALAKDPRADAATVAGQLDTTTPWTDDPTCSSAPLAPLATAPPRSAEQPQQPTPGAFVALIAERVRGTCGWGTVGGSGEPGVTGTLYLGGGDSERVTAAVTTKMPPCRGMDACEKRGELAVAWQFDVPEEYPATVRVSRAIPGGQLVITHTSRRADATTRAFPVPLETLLVLAGDDRFGFTVDPALNRAGAELPLSWRLIAPTGE